MANTKTKKTTTKKTAKREGAERQPRKRSEVSNRAAVFAFVAKRPGSGSGSISAGTGLSKQRVCALLQAEVAAGRMIREGTRCKYTYTLAPEASAAA